ncbi:MAG: HupE/UreJ family protein [Saprospiraceae bacterium]|nr:HupE/UreJ family protein [Saprospiraceae bacterium]
MKSGFQTYLELGFQHITDLDGYDHILFIVALCAIYTLKEWRKVAILVTAFTIGHSVTLALAALEIIPIPAATIEFLIPVTIVITAVYNVTIHKMDGSASNATFNRRLNMNYIFALVFGLIHGLGFSNFLRSMLMPGQEDQLVMQLLSFNIGVELGQLTIVAVILFIAYIVMNPLRVKQREWNVFVSGAAAGIALIMALERIPF